MPKWQVIVGNIGTVVSTDQMGIALVTYAAYRKQSQNNHGRAAGEPVTLMKDGEPYFEHAEEETP